jgi:hypothetical protein
MLKAEFSRLHHIGGGCGHVSWLITHTLWRNFHSETKFVKQQMESMGACCSVVGSGAGSIPDYVNDFYWRNPSRLYFFTGQSTHQLFIIKRNRHTVPILVFYSAWVVIPLHDSTLLLGHPQAYAISASVTVSIWINIVYIFSLHFSILIRLLYFVLFIRIAKFVTMYKVWIHVDTVIEAGTA